MLHQPTDVLTTILIKFDKVTILLPINKLTTINQLKQTFLKIIQSTSLQKSNEKLNQFQELNQFNFFRKDNEKISTSTNWILCDQVSSNLIDLGIKEADVLGVGFLNSNGVCSEPKIQVWVESEINQEE